MQKRIVSLFDLSGNMGRPWAEAGYEVWCFDIQHGERRREYVGDKGGCLVFEYADLSCYANLSCARDHNFILHLKPEMIFAFPPCTDLAASGARHWKAKAAKNPAFQDEAMDLIHIAREIGEFAGVPYMIENPVGRVSTAWRKPDYMFDPADYGGYLPVDDIHPDYPKYIPPRDAYTKRTCLWTGNGFIMPEADPVPLQGQRDYDGKTFSQVSGLTGGKSLRTKNIRSATPRGFAKAVYQANA